MEYQFQIVFKYLEDYYKYYKDIKTFSFSAKDPNLVNNIVEIYGQDLRLCLIEFISLISQNSDIDSAIKDVSQLNEEQLRERIKELLAENTDIKSAKKELERQVNDLSQTKANKEVESLRYQIKQFQRDIKNFEHQIKQLSRELSDERNRSSQYRQSAIDYNNLASRWSELFPQFRTLEDLANLFSSLQQENKKLKTSKQDLEKRFQEIKQELQETQQTLSLAMTRLRDINVNPNLAGGGSRSDKLKNEFSQLKMGLFHEASSKVLNGWREKGSQLTFRSEEFSKIKSILSARVFCGGMAYFAKDKGEIDAELHLIMDVLSGIEDFSPTPAIFQKIQERIQAGLLRSKGVDNSDQALIKYANEVTDLIDRDLEQIANFKTTGEALAEILKFAESGLRLVREIVNDPNSGELFMPENGAAFDESSRETRDEPKGKIKMTICAGYRVAGNVLVKADVITYEPEPPSKKKEMNTASDFSEKSQEENEQQNSEGIEDKNTQNDEHGNLQESPSQPTNLEESNSTESQSLDSPNNHQAESTKDEQNVDSQETSSSIGTTFSGKVTSKSGVSFRTAPRNDDRTRTQAGSGDKLNFEGWTHGENVDGGDGKADDRWYKVAGQDYWVPACYIEGEPPSDLPPMNSGGGDNEAQ